MIDVVTFGTIVRQITSSDDACHSTYFGPFPLSEPETKAMADFILAHRNEIRAIISFHGFGQLLMVHEDSEVREHTCAWGQFRGWPTHHKFKILMPNPSKMRKCKGKMKIIVMLRPILSFFAIKAMPAFP